MAGKRKAYAPFSTSNEAGVSAAPVEGFIEVTQDVRPTIDTGFVDKKGNWQGHRTSDTEFGFYSKEEAIANGGEVQVPADIGTMSMVGFEDIQIAIRVTNGGNFAIQAIMASDGSQPYYNLKPPNAATFLRGNIEGTATTMSSFTNVLADAAESLTADVWNIFYIRMVLRNQARLGFKITNNSGDPSDIESTFLRLVK